MQQNQIFLKQHYRVFKHTQDKELALCIEGTETALKPIEIFERHETQNQRSVEGLDTK